MVCFWGSYVAFLEEMVGVRNDFVCNSGVVCE